MSCLSILRLIGPRAQNASWNINNLKVYRKQTLSGLATGGARGDLQTPTLRQVFALGLAIPILALSIL